MAKLDPVWTQIPARLDRLPWSRFHVLLVAALGVTWILDGLEVTIVGAIGPALQSPHTLGLTPTSIGAAASFYVIGAVVGALGFGWVTDRFGRRVVFFATLAVYLLGVLLTACSWNFISFAIFRAITGLGIGGEYAAINSAIDELIPAKYRGRVDLIVNGSFWIGAAAGSGASLIFLDPHLFGQNVGWRLGFAVGGALGLVILVLRGLVPESPRWLVTHGRNAEAEKVMAGIEAHVAATSGVAPGPVEGGMEIHPRKVFGFGLILNSLWRDHRGRGLLVLVLMAAQAFLYNAVYFTFGVVLTKFEGASDAKVGAFLLPLAVGNFMGPLLLGHLFDTVGRKKMIAATFALSGALVIVVSVLFGLGLLTAVTQTGAWMVIFFFASAAASSAYLTASEIFPFEMRAMAIAVFYAAGTAVGGVMAPSFYGALIQTGSRWMLSGGYLVAAVLMLVAALVELRLGVDAEGQPLESIARPLSGA